MPGKVQIWSAPSASPSSSSSSSSFLIYLDTAEAFPVLYAAGNSCARKSSRANVEVQVGGEGDASELYSAAGYTYQISPLQPTMVYVMASDCSEEMQNISIPNLTVEFTHEGGKFVKHFSKSMQGVLETLIVALVGLLVELGLLWHSYRKLRPLNNGSDALILLVLVSLGFNLLSVILKLAHYDGYSRDGQGFPAVIDFTIFLDVFPPVILISVFIFVSKGWRISGEKVRDWRAILEAIFLYMCAQLALYWWSFKAVDPIEDVIIYHSPPGLILVVLRLVMFLWFLLSLNATWRNEDNKMKKQFYTAFAIFGSTWILSMPAIALAALNSRLWNKQRSIDIFSDLVALATYLIFWGMFGHNAQYVSPGSGERARVPGAEVDPPLAPDSVMADLEVPKQRQN